MAGPSGGTLFSGDPFGDKPFGFGEGESPSVSSIALVLPAQIAHGMAYKNTPFASGSPEMPGMEAAGTADQPEIARTGYMGVNPVMTMECAAQVGRKSSGAMAMGGMESTATTHLQRVPCSIALIGHAMEAAGLASFTGHKESTGALLMQAFEAAGVSTVNVQDAATAALLMQVFEAAGLASFTGHKESTGALLMQAFEAAGVVDVDAAYVPIAQEASGSPEMPGMEAAGGSLKNFELMVALNIPGVKADSVAVVLSLGLAAGAVSTIGFEASGIADLQRNAAGAMELPAQIAAGLAARGFVSHGTLTPLVAQTIEGAAQRGISPEGAAEMAGMETAGAAARIITASGAPEMPAQTFHVHTALAHTASGAPEMPAFLARTVSGWKQYDQMQLYRVQQITWVDDDPVRHAVLVAVKRPISRGHVYVPEPMNYLGFGECEAAGMEASGVCVVA